MSATHPQAFYKALRDCWDAEKMLSVAAENRMPGFWDEDRPRTEQGWLDLLAEKRCELEEHWKV